MYSTLVLDDRQQRRLENLYAKYKRLYTDPENCSPRIIVKVPVANRPKIKDMLDDPLLMLKTELEDLRPHLELEDDRVATVRVQFGTAQVAAAFGCPLHIFEDSLPAAGAPALKTAEEVFQLAQPALNAGWYGKLETFTRLWQKHLPAGVHIQIPDIQSTLNSAHLIRGNDILLDFYDNPEAVEALLDRVADFMIALVPHLNQMIGADPEYFFDWGGLWKGQARISCCSNSMISPKTYLKHVFPRDQSVLQAIGGGRVHYCGTPKEVIQSFFGIAGASSFDYDIQLHDLYALAEQAPKHLTLCQDVVPGSKLSERLLAGDWPRKRNLVVITRAKTITEGKELLGRLRRSIPGGTD